MLRERYQVNFPPGGRKRDSDLLLGNLFQMLLQRPFRYIQKERLKAGRLLESGTCNDTLYQSPAPIDRQPSVFYLSAHFLRGFFTCPKRTQCITVETLN